MNMENLELRIRKTKKGYVVETLEKTFWKNKWVHVISYSGLPDSPFYFRTYEIALEELIKYLRWDLIYKKGTVS